MNIFCGDVAARSLGTPIELMVLKKLYSTELLVSDSHLKLCSVAVSRCIVVLFIFDVVFFIPVPLLVNSAVVPFPALTNLSTNQHATNPLRHPH